VINQGSPFLRSIQLNWSVLARIISFTSLGTRQRLRVDLTSIRLSSVAGELLDEVLQWPRSGSIPTDVDPGFLAQNQTQQCFEDIAATWLTFAIFAAALKPVTAPDHWSFFVAARPVCQLLLAQLFDYEYEQEH